MAQLDQQYLASILRRIISGEDNAFAELYAATYENQFRFALVSLGDSKSALDVVKETYRYAYKNIRSLQDARLMLSWLGQITLRSCYSRIQEKRVNGQEEGSEENRLPMTEILALPYSESQAIYLRYGKGLSWKEIGNILSMSPSSAREYGKQGKFRLSTPIHGAAPQRKSDSEAISLEKAQEILDEVFEEERRSPCEVPLDVLKDYLVYRKDRYGFQKTLLWIVMILFLLLPVFFLTPSISLGEMTTDENGEALVEMQIRSILPVTEIMALMEGERIGVYEIGPGLYEIHPTSNGTLKVAAANVTRQFSAAAMIIQGIDDTKPYLVEYSVADGQLYIQFADDETGVDLSRVYASVGEETQLPVSIDLESGVCVFELSSDDMVVYAFDLSGNQLMLSVKNQ